MNETEDKCGNFLLPEGKETTLAFLVKIFECLDISSLLNLIESCLIKHYNLGKKIKVYIETRPERRLYLLIKRYREEFPRGTEVQPFETRKKTYQIPTPIICACQHGRMDDVELFVNLYPFHKHITNRGVNGYRDDMTLKDMMSQNGRDSHGYDRTPLMKAAYNEDLQIAQYLIKQGGADPNIEDAELKFTNKYPVLPAWNPLHCAVYGNKKNIFMIKFLLEHMSLNSINKKDYNGKTPLDIAYEMDQYPFHREIITLIQLKGGKANFYDANGIYVEKGNGDLND
jgi:hypothetical protein